MKTTKEKMTQNILKKYLHYNPDNGVFTRALKTANFIRVGDVAGWLDKASGYRKIYLRNKQYSAHRLAWLYMVGEFPSDQIDHINHIRDDNRFSNLRTATHSENQRNASIRYDNASGVTGVYWSKPRRKWQSEIYVNGKKIYGGSFGCVTAAAIARKALETKHGFHENHGKLILNSKKGTVVDTSKFASYVPEVKE